MNGITQDSTITAIPFTDNRQTKGDKQTKSITYVPPSYPYVGSFDIPDIDTQVANVFFNYPNGQLGWKSFPIIQWTGNGSLVYVSMTVRESNNMNPLMSQVNIK